MTIGLTMLGDTLAASPNRGRSMGLVRGTASLVWALGAFAGGRIADAFSLSTAFLVCAGMYGVAALIALLLEEAPPAVRAAAVPSAVPSAGEPLPVAAPRQAGLPLLFLAGVVLWGAADFASSTMWPVYLESVGYSKTAISSFFALGAVVELPAMVLLGALADVVGRALVLAAGGFLFALVQASYIWIVGNLPVLVGVQILRGVGFGSYGANAMTYATEQGGRAERGSHSGLFNAMASAGQLAGMFLGGTVAQAFGFPVLYALCALMAAASGACFLALRWKGRRERAALGEQPYAEA
jgi:MFS family permease